MPRRSKPVPPPSRCPTAAAPPPLTTPRPPPRTQPPPPPAQKATQKLNGNPAILLDGSTLPLSRGALASVTGGSTLTATGGNGALVLMKNGSTLNIGNQLSPGRDTLLILSGASTVSLKFLVKFEGALLNTINVWNTLAPTTFISGIPIRIEGGMTSTNTFNIGS